MIDWVLSAALAGLQPGPATSDPASPDWLQWSAPSSCPAAEAIVDRVEEFSSSEDPVRSLRAQGDVSTEGGGFVLKLSIRTHAGGVDERQLTDPSCEVLADAAALAIAMAVDVERGASPLTPTPPPDDPTDVVPPPSAVEPPPKGPGVDESELRESKPEPGPEVDPPPPASPPAPESELPTPAPGWRPCCVELGLSGGASVGVVPRPTLELGGLVAVPWPRWVVAVGVRHDFQQDTQRAGAGVEVRVTTAVVRGAYRWSLPRGFEVRPAIDVELGSARGRGIRVQNPAVDRIWWRAGGANLAVGHVWPVGMGLFLEGGVRVPLGRLRFVTRDQQTRFEFAPVGGSVRVTAQWRFGREPGRK